MGGNDTHFVANSVNKEGRQKVHRQLHDKIDGDKECDLLQGDMERILKYHKQQRQIINNHGLHQAAAKAAEHGKLVIFLHGNASQSLASLYQANKKKQEKRHRWCLFLTFIQFPLWD